VGHSGIQWNCCKMMMMMMISLPLRNTEHPLPTTAAGRQRLTPTQTRRHPYTAPTRRVGPVDGSPQPIWPTIGPPKLSPEGVPGPGGQSKGMWTWTLVLARPHGVETTFQKIRTNYHRARCGVAARPIKANGIATQGGSRRGVAEIRYTNLLY